ncbi:MAG TPA: bifunctional glutamate N-acetyltransferase/amino-acid acetyltransferase ArgJ [Terriglobia bacterium]|nr:bifunctional glutamate N-acetyltransferase/amino-acid acetyltransferase ArgJ [Terriglobia bacterium]
MPKWIKTEGHLGTPQGFCASATHAGIKNKEGALDLALIYSESAITTAAGVFTTNRAAAAPVALSRRHLAASRGMARAIVVNSGNANACTGAAGVRTAEETTRAAAVVLGVPREQILVASTGVIGVPIETSLITRQLPALAANLSPANAEAAATAIMTTDTFPKVCALRAKIDGKAVHLAGIAKGAGMIHPRMGTMLSFITTDAAVPARDLQKQLRRAAGESFNRITVDGDTSTNDTVIVLASGLSGVRCGAGGAEGQFFLDGLTELCQTLAKLIVKDGEGAKKLVTVQVTGARNVSDADRIARAIANSPLVKTAIAGSDPNWGRILCAAGYSGAVFDPTKVEIRVNGLVLCRRGCDSGFDEPSARKLLSQPELTVGVDLHQGKASARIWTCDLTHEYITINASYRS